MFEKLLSEIQVFEKRFHHLREQMDVISKESGDVFNKDNFLVKKGFLIKHYVLILSKVNKGELKTLRNHIHDVLNQEKDLEDKIDSFRSDIRKLESIYKKRHKKSLYLDLIFSYLKNSIHNLKIASGRIDFIDEEIEDSYRFHKGSMSEKVSKQIFGLEKVLNQVRHFFQILEEVIKKIEVINQNLFFPEPRTYGRASSIPEYKKCISTSRLASGKDPTPVFDCPDSELHKIKSMSPDERRTFFASIGVEGRIKVVFFRTNLKPVNPIPITNSNGLREYKFPQGTEIEIFDAA
ncbi:hypothetical protein KY334_05585 [Candidatus Woesearchaeota archaeon]|nr:hypothetical protein [Candidatus Woesearchaeota archaeon]